MASGRGKGSSNYFIFVLSARNVECKARARSSIIMRRVTRQDKGKVLLKSRSRRLKSNDFTSLRTICSCLPAIFADESPIPIDVSRFQRSTIHVARFCERVNRFKLDYRSRNQFRASLSVRGSSNRLNVMVVTGDRWITFLRKFTRKNFEIMFTSLVMLCNNKYTEKLWNFSAFYAMVWIKSRILLNMENWFVKWYKIKLKNRYLIVRWNVTSTLRNYIIFLLFMLWFELSRGHF